MQPDDASVVDIHNAAQLVIQFTSNLDKQSFLADAKTQSAVLHQLLILGEAVKRLSKEFRTRHEQLPWQMMAGMRDILIHQYDSVDFDEVWETVRQDLPLVIDVLKPLLPHDTD